MSPPPPSRTIREREGADEEEPQPELGRVWGFSPAAAGARKVGPVTGRCEAQH